MGSFWTWRRNKRNARVRAERDHLAKHLPTPEPQQATKQETLRQIREQICHMKYQSSFRKDQQRDVRPVEGSHRDGVNSKEK